jgi:hypothetical protein
MKTYEIALEHTIQKIITINAPDDISPDDISDMANQLCEVSSLWEDITVDEFISNLEYLNHGLNLDDIKRITIVDDSCVTTTDTRVIPVE